MQSLGVCYDDFCFLKEVRMLFEGSENTFLKKSSKSKEEGTRIKPRTSLHSIIRKKLDQIVISAINLDDKNISLLTTVTGTVLAPN